MTNIIINTDIYTIAGVDETGVDEKGVDETSSRQNRSRQTRYTPYKQLPEKDVQNREEKTTFKLAISSVIYTKSKLRSVQIYDFALITWRKKIDTRG